MASNQSLTVVPVSNWRDRRDFHAVRRLVYRCDPAAVQPLNSQIRFALDQRQNPFYEHARRQDFICRRGRKVVGRISGIVDDLHNSYYQAQQGFFGFFESIDDSDVARLLINEAASWLREQGCESMRGPVHPSMKSEFGVLVQGNEYPPFIMMGHTPAYYARLLEEQGFAVIRTFHANLLHEDANTQKYRQNWDDYEALCQKVRKRYPEIKLRSAHPRDMENDVRRINELGNVVRKEGWGFVPFTPAELESVVRRLKPVLLSRLVHLAEVDGEAIGYIMAMPDFNWALKRAWGPWDWMRLPQVAFWLTRNRRVRIFGLGVHPKFRHAGVVGLLIKRLFDESGERFPGWEFSWIDSENVKSIRGTQRFVPLQVYKTYHLYQKALDRVDNAVKEIR